MGAASRSEPVGEPEKAPFVDGVHHLNDGPLDDLIFQRRDGSTHILHFFIAHN